jgi:hypothetical protein
MLNQIQQGLLTSTDTDELMSSRMNLAIFPTKLEQMVKKSYGSAMDFDYSFCKTIYKEDSPGYDYINIYNNIIINDGISISSSVTLLLSLLLKLSQK